MKDARYEEIHELVERFDKLASNEAFVAALAEHGVGATDLDKYAKERDKRDRAVRVARRRS